MKKEDENKNSRDYKKCPECGSGNFKKGWGAEREHTYVNGKCVRQKYFTVGNYTDFLCIDCGWQRTDVE